MSESEHVPGDISDDQLPEDLQPTEDNPLARHPRETGDEADQIGADREEGDADNPTTELTYGSAGGSGDDAQDDGQDGQTPDAEEDDGSDTLENGGGGAG